MKFAAKVHVILDIVTLVVPRGDVPLSVWLFWKLAALVVTLSIISLWLLSNQKAMWKHYRLLVSCLACFYLLVRTVTQRNAGLMLGEPEMEKAYDEGYNLFL